MHGRRECDCTTVTFDLQSSGDASDTITIEFDDHRTMSPSMATIRGKFEAAELPGHFRWLADSIARHAEHKGPAYREEVTSEKLRGGGA